MIHNCALLCANAIRQAPLFCQQAPDRNPVLFDQHRLWPVYLPLSLWLIERRPGRRRMLAALGVIGVIVSVTAWLLLARWHR